MSKWEHGLTGLAGIQSAQRIMAGNGEGGISAGTASPGSHSCGRDSASARSSRSVTPSTAAPRRRNSRSTRQSCGQSAARRGAWQQGPPSRWDRPLRSPIDHLAGFWVGLLRKFGPQHDHRNAQDLLERRGVRMAMADSRRRHRECRPGQSRDEGGLLSGRHHPPRVDLPALDVRGGIQAQRGGRHTRDYTSRPAGSAGRLAVRAELHTLPGRVVSAPDVGARVNLCELR